MEPMTMMLLGLGIGAVGNAVSAYMQAGETEKAQKLIEAAVAEYGPEAEGVIADYAAQGLEQSKVRAETEAPEAVAAQREALRRMQQVAAGGYTPEEEAALRNIQSQTAAQAAAQQATLAQQFQQRGTLGSGAQLAMAQSAGQAAAQRAGMQGLQTAAEAQRRAFQAMQGLGGLGTSVRGQAYGEAERRAAAEDEKKRFEANSRLNTAMNKANLSTQGAVQSAGFGVQPAQNIGAYATGVSTGLMSEAAKTKRGQGLTKDGG
jgi:hypothetical protein